MYKIPDTLEASTLAGHSSKYCKERRNKATFLDLSQINQLTSTAKLQAWNTQVGGFEKKKRKEKEKHQRAPVASSSVSCLDFESRDHWLTLVCSCPTSAENKMISFVRLFWHVCQSFMLQLECVTSFGPIMQSALIWLSNDTSVGLPLRSKQKH